MVPPEIKEAADKCGLPVHELLKQASEAYEDFLNSDNETLILEATYNLSMLVFKPKI